MIRPVPAIAAAFLLGFIVGSLYSCQALACGDPVQLCKIQQQLKD